MQAGDVVRLRNGHGPEMRVLYVGTVFCECAWRDYRRWFWCCELELVEAVRTGAVAVA